MKKLLLILICSIAIAQRPSVTMKELSAQEQDRLLAAQAKVDAVQEAIMKAVKERDEAQAALNEIERDIAKTLAPFEGECSGLLGTGKRRFRRTEIVAGRYILASEGEENCGNSITLSNGSGSWGVKW